MVWLNVYMSSSCINSPLDDEVGYSNSLNSQPSRLRLQVLVFANPVLKVMNQWYIQQLLHPLQKKNTERWMYFSTKKWRELVRLPAEITNVLPM